MNTTKNPARLETKAGFYISTLPHAAAVVQEHRFEKPTPQAVINTFGCSPDILLTVVQSLINNYLHLLGKQQWVDDVEPITQKYPPGNFLRELYVLMLRRNQREIHQIRRHIRFLGQCYDLICGTHIFSPRPEKVRGQVDVARIKEHAAVEDVVAKSVALRRAGQTYKGLCPFHEDKNPSLVVYPAPQSRWWCFACNDGGDAISFVQKIRNCGFREAVAELQSL